MFNNNSQALVHLPGKPAPDNDPQLPRGECGFIVSEPDGRGSPRQRCLCRSFYPDAVVRSRCGCGHQAWHHEAEPLSSVSMDEHLTVVEELRRLKEKADRVDALEQELVKRERIWKGIEERLYENMRWLKVHMDDKVEAVVDKTADSSEQIKSVQEKLTLVDEITMELENRIDRIELDRGFYSREATPIAATPKPPPLPQIPLLLQTQHTTAQLPIRTEKKYPLSWNARVIFVPRKSQKFAFDPESNGYKRCATRGLQQNLDFSNQDSSSFTNVIETSFKTILRNRPWMPMTGHRPADEPFGRMALHLLPPDLCQKDVWDYPFVEDHCIAHDKMQGDILYITLQCEDVTWQEIRFLPAVFGADELCWQHDEELDGVAKYKSLDSEIMYDYQDPPPTYSSRTHSMMDRALSKLDVLADSASMVSRVERLPTSYSSERSSLRSFETEETDDEHRDKKPKLRTKQSLPNIHTGSASSQPIYVSGRSKRKMPVREKGPKEPLHFSVTNVAKWRPNLLHPHSNKGKEATQ